MKGHWKKMTAEEFEAARKRRARQWHLIAWGLAIGFSLIVSAFPRVKQGEPGMVPLPSMAKNFAL